MRVLGRIVLFLLVLTLLAGLAGVLGTLVTVPWLSGAVQQAHTAAPWLPTALAAVVLVFAALCVLALVMLLTVPTRNRFFIVNRSMGDIEITKQSIESVATGTLAGITGLKRFCVQVRGNPKPGKIRLQVDAEPADGVSLAALGDEVQTQLSEAMRSSLAVDPKHVRVRVAPVQPGHAMDSRHAKVPRVV